MKTGRPKTITCLKSYMKAKNRERRQKAKAKGRCQDCVTSKAVKGKTRCRMCAKINRMNAQHRRYIIKQSNEILSLAA